MIFLIVSSCLLFYPQKLILVFVFCCSPPVGVGLLDFKKRSTPSLLPSSSLLLVSQHVNTNVNENVNRNIKKNVNQNVNKNVNRNVNKNVSRNQPRTQFQVHNDTSEENEGKCQENVNREPNFRYTTTLLKKMEENDKKISAGNPILGKQRYF